MSRVFNFSAGPANLPVEVLEQAQEELLDWNRTGASVMEVSHRGKPFVELAVQAETDLRNLLAIPASYKVLFLQGGAQLQFAMVPLNLLGDKRDADYLDTGLWSKKAIQEGRRFANVNVAASSESQEYTCIPAPEEWQLNDDAAYLHYTPNETIGGVEFHWVPESGTVPLVADMSSTILSRPIDVNRFGLIYAGAQKNIGPAGLTLVIVREDLLGNTAVTAPSLFDYARQAEAGSMLNTVPTFIWYMAALMFKWLKARGGLSAMAEVNRRKAEKLYSCIDRSGGFYINPVDRKCRSWMNVPFTLSTPELEQRFLSDAENAGLAALKGHRSVGGMRASIYNAMPEAGVDALISFMSEFQRVHG